MINFLVTGDLDMDYLDRIDEDENDNQAVESDLDGVDSEEEEPSNDNTEDKKDDFEDGICFI